MGARGPAPKPFELKVLEGNRGNRPLDLTSTFRPEVGMPDMPAYLGKEARKAWKRLSPELLRYNLLARVDRDAFAALCQTIGRIELVERAINGRMKAVIADGKDPVDALLDRTPNGLQVQSAIYQVLNKEYDKVKSWLDSFGLKPDARAGVSTAIRAQLQLFPGGADTPPGDGGAPPAAGPAPSVSSSFADFQ